MTSARPPFVIWLQVPEPPTPHPFPDGEGVILAPPPGSPSCYSPRLWRLGPATPVTTPAEALVGGVLENQKVLWASRHVAHPPHTPGGPRMGMDTLGVPGWGGGLAGEKVRPVPAAQVQGAEGVPGKTVWVWGRDRPPLLARRPRAEGTLSRALPTTFLPQPWPTTWLSAQRCTLDSLHRVGHVSPTPLARDCGLGAHDRPR